MSPELQIIFAVLGLALSPSLAALGAWGAVRYYFGRYSAKVEGCEQRLDNHEERLLYVERQI